MSNEEREIQGDDETANKKTRGFGTLDADERRKLSQRGGKASGGPRGRNTKPKTKPDL